MPLRTRPDWREGFLFVGEHLAVDFANTRLEETAGAVEPLASWPGIVRWFVAADLLTAAAARALEDAWAGTAEARLATRELLAFRDRLREALARLVRARPDRAFTAELNRQLDAHPVRVRVRDFGHPAAWEPVFRPRRPDELVAPIADAAASLLVDADRARVRQCEGCSAYFYDVSRNGRRRWCRMRMCGNRAKVARYADRRRTERRAGGAVSTATVHPTEADPSPRSRCAAIETAQGAGVARHTTRRRAG